MNKTINGALLGLAVVGGSMTTADAAPKKGAASDKMNIVMLFVDDLGWTDLGFRQSKFETPNIDRLMSESMNFERAYVAQPASSASRAGLLTGQEPVRTGIVRHIENKDAGSGREFNMWPDDPINMPSRNWLELDQITYAERLKELGYYNMFVGKWHMGGEEYWPQNQGFDECFGLSDFGNVSSYYAPFFRYPAGDDTTTAVPEGALMSDYLTDAAVDMIENYDGDKPFQMSMFYYNVHTPNEGRRDLVERYMKEGMSRLDANYAAQVAVVDMSVGEIRQAIEDKGIADNTIVIFFSDQGGPFSNYPLRGCKLIDDTLAEGGIRVPLLIHYPGVTKGGEVCDTPVSAIDFFPTFIEIASGKKCKDKQTQGVSLLPLINGKDIKERNLHFWRSYHDQYAAMICGDWKIIKRFSGSYQMFNLRTDIGETTDIQNIEPERFEKMKAELWAWEKETIPAYEGDYRDRLPASCICE
ncbi:MAG: sulfatase [Rikenellaceae bacterium]